MSDHDHLSEHETVQQQAEREMRERAEGDYNDAVEPDSGLDDETRAQLSSETVTADETEQTGHEGNGSESKRNKR